MLDDMPRTPLLDAAPNGAAEPPAIPLVQAPRWRIRRPQVKRIELAGEFAGAWLDMVLNPGMDVLLHLGTAEGMRWHLHHIIRAWNFEDDDGHPLPVNADSVGRLDVETLTAIQTAWGAARDLSKSG